MKSLQLVSTVLFLLFTIPALLFFSTRKGEVEASELDLLDSLDYDMELQEDAFNDDQAFIINVSAHDPSAQKALLD